MTQLRRSSGPSGRPIAWGSASVPQAKRTMPKLAGVRCPKCSETLNRRAQNGRMACRHCGGTFTFAEVQQAISAREAASVDARARREREHMRTLASLAESERETTENAIYYIRFRDAVKIGTSTNVAGRLADLPWEEVMALEPGGLAMEKLRHTQMQAHRLQGEWFELSDEVRGLIESVQESNVQWLADQHPHLGALPCRRRDAEFGV